MTIPAPWTGPPCYHGESYAKLHVWAVRQIDPSRSLACFRTQSRRAGARRAPFHMGRVPQASGLEVARSQRHFPRPSVSGFCKRGGAVICASCRHCRLPTDRRTPKDGACRRARCGAGKRAHGGQTPEVPRSHAAPGGGRISDPLPQPAPAGTPRSAGRADRAMDSQRSSSEPVRRMFCSDHRSEHPSHRCRSSAFSATPGRPCR